MTTPLAATRKPYATPFGPAPVATEFLDLLESQYSGDLYADEFSHHAEHSLEFQAVHLRYLERVGGTTESAIVPLLCGSLHDQIEPGGDPRSTACLEKAIEALGRTIAMVGRRVCLLAGADLAHVGPQFGDAVPLTRSRLEEVERGDAEMLENIRRADADGFYRQVMADSDARRICGLAPIYFVLSLLDGASGRLLRYDQWVDSAGWASVTYAGVIFES
jgi:hypothetical protein